MDHVHALGIRCLAVLAFAALLLLPGCGSGGVESPSSTSETGHNPEMVAAIQQNRQAIEKNQLPPWKRGRAHR